jgi:hypothetical protein
VYAYDFNVGKFITRAIGRGGPLKSSLKCIDFHVGPPLPMAPLLWICPHQRREWYEVYLLRTANLLPPPPSGTKFIYFVPLPSPHPPAVQKNSEIYNDM